MTFRSPATIGSIAQDSVESGDDFGLIICRSGEMAIGFGHGTVVLGEGDAILIAHKHVVYLESDDGQVLEIWIPRGRLMSRVSDIDDLVMRRLPAQTPILAMLTHHAAALLHHGSTKPATRHADVALSYIHDLVALMLNASRHDDELKARDGIGATRLIAAKIHIIGSSFRKSFSIKALAQQLGVTTRYVQRLFEIDGTTFSAFMLDHRLNSAYRILLDVRYRKRPVSEIAYDVGFGDLSYFNRCFRRRFGETPSAIRQAVLSEPALEAD